MSGKKKKYLSVITVLLLIAVGLHFVPVYTSQKGYLDADYGNACMGTTDIDPNAFINDDYRVALGGLASFRNDKKILITENPVTTGVCANQIRLRLFIL